MLRCTNFYCGSVLAVSQILFALATSSDYRSSRQLWSAVFMRTKEGTTVQHPSPKLFLLMCCKDPGLWPNQHPHECAHLVWCLNANFTWKLHWLDMTLQFLPNHVTQHSNDIGHVTLSCQPSLCAARPMQQRMSSRSIHIKLLGPTLTIAVQQGFPSHRTCLILPLKFAQLLRQVICVDTELRSCLCPPKWPFRGTQLVKFQPHRI